MVASTQNAPKVENTPTAEKRIPVAMLVILFLAFGGALGIKAYEDYRASTAQQLSSVVSASQSLAGHIGVALADRRTRLETLLTVDASPSRIRDLGSFSRVQNQSPTGASWARLSETGEVEIFARDANGSWTSAAVPSDDILGNTGNAAVTLTDRPPRSSFQIVDGSRQAHACTQVLDTQLSACLTTPAPLVSQANLYTLFIYVLLLLAPALAVFGLVQSLKESKAVPGGISSARALPSPDQNFSPILPDFEVAGLIGFWKFSPRTLTMTLGDEAAAMLGAPVNSELSLEDFLRLVPVEESRALREALVATDPLQDISVTFSTRPAGKKQYFELMGGASNGDVSGALLNVTDRIHAKMRSRLAEVVARAAIDAHPGPFAVWDSRKRLTHWNSAFLRDFNLEKSSLYAGASYDFVMAEVSRFVRVERPLGDDSTARELYLISGRWIRLLDRRTSGNGLITVGLDISNLKQQEQSLSKSERKLRTMVAELQRTRGQAQALARRYADEKSKAERASQAKSVFLASMSHELRTPLNAINGFSEMIAKEVYGSLGDERYKGYAEDILESGQHLLDMINDILDMAKIEAGKMQISRRPIDPSDAVDSAVRLIRRRASDKKVSLSFDPDDDLPEIQGDHLAIKQMTLNLISNAIKFTDEGGRIKVTVAQESDWIVIRVSDTGVGISAEDLPRLAQPFEQASSGEGRNIKGTGLGLALTKSFAEMHGGRFTIESTLGEGTTVSIFLPVGPTEKVDADDEVDVSPPADVATREDEPVR